MEPAPPVARALQVSGCLFLLVEGPASPGQKKKAQLLVVLLQEVQQAELCSKLVVLARQCQQNWVKVGLSWIE